MITRVPHSILAAPLPARVARHVGINCCRFNASVPAAILAACAALTAVVAAALSAALHRCRFSKLASVSSSLVSIAAAPFCRVPVRGVPDAVRTDSASSLASLVAAAILALLARSVCSLAAAASASSSACRLTADAFAAAASARLCSLPASRIAAAICPPNTRFLASSSLRAFADSFTCRRCSRCAFVSSFQKYFACSSAPFRFSSSAVAFACTFSAAHAACVNVRSASRSRLEI
eukprot:6078926-Prymnesium_polylepis.1